VPQEVQVQLRLRWLLGLESRGQLGEACRSDWEDLLQVLGALRRLEDLVDFRHQEGSLEAHHLGLEVEEDRRVDHLDSHHQDLEVKVDRGDLLEDSNPHQVFNLHQAKEGGSHHPALAVDDQMQFSGIKSLSRVLHCILRPSLVGLD